VHLISSSVPELSAKSITVVDQAGNLLSAANAGTRGLDVSQLKYTQEIEQGYIRRIEAILQPILGAGNVHAQVAADIDFSVVENTDEKYRPNQEPGSAAIRSQQSSESGQSGGAASGVPGALTNQPPPDPVAPITTPAPAARAGTPPGAAAPGQLKMSAELGSAGTAPRSAGATGNSRKDVTTNYEVDRSIRHTQQGAGGIKRLSVAVVVNYRGSTAAAGKRAALTAAELEQIRNLARQAMGFSADRGDSLNVVNSLFASDAETPKLPVWRQPENIEIAKSSGKYLLLGLLALYLWLAVARPLLRKHLQPPAPAGVAGADGAGAEAAEQVPPARTQEEREQRHQANIQYAQELAAKEPAMVAMLIKHWTEKHVE
jgi:flagellar M-ring protein FliF